ncbi:MAG: bifunctional tetrahydrofolate synthase/dihydrofolate synthase [Thiobacillaceae bacterium]
MSLQAWLARLELQHPKSIDLGLERSREVLARLDIGPTCPIILVGGTNGKGSTCAYLEAILLAAGYRAGLYTSPHLLMYNERVRVNGRNCDDDAIVAGLAAVEAVKGSTSLTYFEHGTLGAAWQFVQEKVDVALFEVGLGGRLDAVNLFEPDVSIVTSIDLDHQEWLGTDCETIGFEKAGIFRRGKPAVCSDPLPPQSLINHASDIGADLQRINTDFLFAQHGESWDFLWRGQTLSGLPKPVMAGDYQIRNASAALAGLMNLQEQLPVGKRAIDQGLRTARAVGRFHTVAERPEVILDVGHNPEAARALAGNLALRPVSGRTLAVFALLADKDLEGVVLPLKNLIDVWHVCGLGGPRSRPVEKLAADVKTILQKEAVECYPSPVEGFAAAIGAASQNDRILVFGSFHTVASVMAMHPTWQFR